MPIEGKGDFITHWQNETSKKVNRKSIYHYKELYPQGFRAYQPLLRHCMSPL